MPMSSEKPTANAQEYLHALSQLQSYPSEFYLVDSLSQETQQQHASKSRPIACGLSSTGMGYTHYRGPKQNSHVMADHTICTNKPHSRSPVGFHYKGHPRGVWDRRISCSFIQRPIVCLFQLLLNVRSFIRLALNLER